MSLTRTTATGLLAVLLLAATALPACAGMPASAEPLRHFPQSEVSVLSEGQEHVFRVWVADTPARQQQGLMYQDKLDPQRGMLFPYDPPQVVYFWMKNTPLSLDLLFVAPDGRILNIVDRAKPMSTETLASAGPVGGVLELVGGTAARLGIRPGDRVVHPIFSVLRLH